MVGEGGGTTVSEGGEGGDCGSCGGLGEEVGPVGGPEVIEGLGGVVEGGCGEGVAEGVGVFCARAKNVETDVN